MKKIIYLYLLLFLLNQGFCFAQETMEEKWPKGYRGPAAYCSLEFSKYKRGFETFIKFLKPIKKGYQIIAPEIIDKYGNHRKGYNEEGKLIPKWHYGWDLGAPVGTVISFVLKGNSKIVKIKADKWNGNKKIAQFGKRVEIECKYKGNKYRITFCHLGNYKVRIGELIKVTDSQSKYGIAIGTLGMSGRDPEAGRPHLHLQVYKNNKLIDPILLFGQK